MRSKGGHGLVSLPVMYQRCFATSSCVDSKVHVCHGDPRRRQQDPPFVGQADRHFQCNHFISSVFLYWRFGGLYALAIPFAFAFGRVWMVFQLRQTNNFIIKFQRMSKGLKSIQLMIWKLSQKNNLTALFGFKSVFFLLVVHRNIKTRV